MNSLKKTSLQRPEQTLVKEDRQMAIQAQHMGPGAMNIL